MPWSGVVLSAVSPVVLAWFCQEPIASAGLAGLAERVLGAAQLDWPFVVVMSCRHPVTVTARYRLLHGDR
jgi:predicted protein tyrosine phosphatase